MALLKEIGGFFACTVHNTHHQIMKYGPKNGEKILKNPIFLNFANTWRPFTDGDEALVVIVGIACLDELFIDGALYTRTILFSSSIGSTELSIKSEGKRLSN